MGRKNITVKVDEDLYDKYKAHCKDKGLVISRKFEIFAEKELKKEDNKV